MENLYEILEVSPNASNEVIEKAYRVLVKKYHPDVCVDKKSSEFMIKKINHAYDILSNPEKREEYDIKLHQENEIMINAQNNEYDNTGQEIKYDIYRKVDNIYNEKFKNIHIDSRVIIIVIFIALVLLGFVCRELFVNFSNIFENDNQDINNTQHVDDDKAKEPYINFVNAIKDLKIEEAKGYLVNGIALQNFDSNTISPNIDLYKKLISDTNIEIIDVSSTNDTAKIDVKIKRINIEDIFMSYILGVNMSSKVLDYADKKKILSDSIENYKDTNVIKSTTIYANKINGQWKVSFTSSEFSKIMGMSVDSYIKIFNDIGGV